MAVVLQWVNSGEARLSKTVTSLEKAFGSGYLLGELLYKRGMLEKKDHYLYTFNDMANTDGEEFIKNNASAWDAMQRARFRSGCRSRVGPCSSRSAIC